MPAAPATQRARTAYGARALEEGRHALAAGDYEATRRWAAEARAAGVADAGQLEAAIAAAQDEARPADSVVSESTLARTTYLAPEFPLVARERNIQGWVDLEFLVGSDGAVSDLTVSAAQPVGVFEQAALDAVRHWRYRPVLRDGHAVSQRARVRVRFAVQP